MSLSPLPEGSVLAGRFEISSLLGKGGFSIAYLATDLQRNDACVVKELAPSGAERNEEGEVDLAAIEHARPQVLRERFLEEARLLDNLGAPGILPLRDAFIERGTAYYVTDSVPATMSLDAYVAREGRLASDEAEKIMLQLMDILEQIHAKGILHHDIKPSNVLISPTGKVYLIDFGAAREWHADQVVQHTIFFTPGYAPLEQLSESSRRGPSTDIYGLCATAYHMLAGYPPRSAPERAAGNALVPLSKLRPDAGRSLVDSIEAGLALAAHDRPQSIRDLRAMLARSPLLARGASTVAEFDAIAVRLMSFSFQRRECPSCGGLLESPKPIKKGLCPVCHSGNLRARRFEVRLCPSCHHGTLHQRGGRDPLLFCPRCKTGVLDWTKKGLLSKSITAICPSCKARLEGDRDSGTCEGESHPWDGWLEISGRSDQAMICDECHSQLDILSSGRWMLQKPAPKEYAELYPDEWAKVAAGLSPNAGNTFCDACDAEFWIDEERATLLSFQNDPFRFGERYLERTMNLTALPMKAAGKTSGNAGLLCQQCSTEFDQDGPLLKLVSSPDVHLMDHTGDTLEIEDWHRIARGLPIREEEDEFEARFEEALREDIRSREILFESEKPEILWRGESQLLDEGEDGSWSAVSSGPIVITQQELNYGKLFRKLKLTLADCRVREVGEGLVEFAAEEDGAVFQIEPVTLRLQLQSGVRSLRLEASDLLGIIATSR